MCHWISIKNREFTKVHHLSPSDSEIKCDKCEAEEEHLLS